MATYELTDDELLILDGKASEAIQVEIEKAKERKQLHSDPVVARILAESLKMGTFEYQFIHDMTFCRECKKSSGYALHTRSGKYHRKGDKNYDKPLKFSGIRCNSGFVTIQGHGNFCAACDKQHGWLATIVNEILTRSLPIELVRDTKTKFRRDAERQCYQCEQTMFESEMGREHTLMGNGTYAATCPHCKAKSIIFGRNHKVTGKFRMLPAIATGV